MMIHTRRKSLFLFAVFFFLCCAPKPPAPIDVPTDQGPYQLTVLHFNDLHGHLNPGELAGKEMGGAARLAAAIHEIRAAKERQGIPTLVLFGGDLQTGTRINEHYEGIATRDVLNQMGIDAAVIGNHEFDYGFDAFVRVAAGSNFPWLAGNVRLKKPVNNVLDVSFISMRNGLRAGIVGVTTDETEGEGRLVYEPAEELVEAADERSELLILLSHSGKDCDRYLAGKFKDQVDLIIGAHNHVLLTPVMNEDGLAPIAQAGSYGYYLGQADLTIFNDRVTKLKYTLHLINRDVNENKKVAALIRDFESRMPARERDIIGEALIHFNGDREVIRREESNLGDFVCDLVRTEFVADADVVILNGGGFRTSIHKGPVARQDIQDVFPFGNRLSSVDVTGRELVKILNSLVSGNPDDDPGQFPQVSGLRFEIDGRRVVEETLTVGGGPLDPRQTYRLVINDFMARGKQDLRVFGELQNKPAPALRYQKGYAHDTLADLLIQYIEKTGSISKTTDGRILRIADWVPVPGEEAPCWEKEAPGEAEAMDPAA